MLWKKRADRLSKEKTVLLLGREHVRGWPVKDCLANSEWGNRVDIQETTLEAANENKKRFWQQVDRADLIMVLEPLPPVGEAEGHSNLPAARMFKTVSSDKPVLFIIGDHEKDSAGSYTVLSKNYRAIAAPPWKVNEMLSAEQSEEFKAWGRKLAETVSAELFTSQEHGERYLR